MRAGADNNFDALRLAFAGLVFAYHLSVLPGIAAWHTVRDVLAVGAELGVQGFFVLSGYLVYGSLGSSRSVRDYAGKRVRRLVPAYAMVVVGCALCALIFVPAARQDPGGVAAYLGWNLAFMNFMAPTLPGVFGDNPMAAVNGSLWTIKVEVMFYIVLPLLAWLMARGPGWRWGLILVGYGLAEAWRLGFPALADAVGRPGLATLAQQLPGQMAFFLAGMAGHFVGRAEFREAKWLVLALGGLVLSFAVAWLEPLRAVSLGWVCLALAMGRGRVVDAAQFGDVSYGVYIVHFPIIQTLVAAGAFAAAPGLAAAGAVGLVLLASVALWWLIERPALRPDSAYRRG
jgi:peptidoglycan/LPS O-acetylase OafA/YrhL